MSRSLSRNKTYNLKQYNAIKSTICLLYLFNRMKPMLYVGIYFHREFCNLFDYEQIETNNRFQINSTISKNNYANLTKFNKVITSYRTIS